MKTFFQFIFFQKELTYKIIFVCLIFVTITKLTLIGNGFLAFPDEIRYIISGKILKEFQTGNLYGALENVFSTQARPADTLIKTIPNIIQYLTAKIFGLEYYETKNSYGPFLFNFAVYIGILRILYKISKLFLKNETQSLLCVFIFSCLANSYIYIRHGLPYDTSLLILLIVFYKTAKLKEEDYSYLKTFSIGFWAFFGYLAYPGYSILVIIIGLFLFANSLSSKNLKKRIKHLIQYGFGCFLCLAIFEISSRIVEKSYFQALGDLSKTLNQGSFEESFSFIFKYLYKVEKATGILLLIGILSCFISLIKTAKITKKQPLQLLFILTILLFVFFTGSGYFFHKTMMSGRVLHQFLPFLCLFFTFGIYEVFQKYAFQQILILGFATIATINFYIQFIDYQKYAFPRDVAWKLYKEYYPKKFNDVCEIQADSWSVLPITSVEIEKFSKKKSDRKMKIVNSCNIHPFKKELFIEYKPNEREQLIFSQPSYLNFEPYKFEGYNIDERENVGSLNLKIKVYLE